MKSNLLRSAFRAALGRRPPIVAGDLEVPGLGKAVSIRRDRWGIPHIEASGETDGWYGLGFCHGQDRAFQLETLVRLIRGTLASLVGKDGVEMDRVSRRIGIGQHTDTQFQGLQPEIRSNIEAYVRGINAGSTAGLTRKPHEFVLLRSRPSAWTPPDVVGMSRLLSFMFATNADAELARLKILISDGPEALSALDPSFGESWQGILKSEAVAPAVDRLGEDLSAFSSFVGAGGASNSWVLSGSRTATGRPLLANDPHLPALLPSSWYLAHIRTPGWSAAGATLVGAPAVLVGHNGFAAWGITAALIDNTDLFQEQMGPDGKSIRQGDGFVPCPVRHERIKVRYGRSIQEDVVTTPRGPVVGPAFDREVGALSMAAFWLGEEPIEGFLGVHKAAGFEQFRRLFAHWPGPDLNISYADESGTIGWQLAGAVPRRRKGWGTIPLQGWDPTAGWEPDPVGFDDMPYVVDPDRGYLATANTRPYPDVAEPFLGVDWIDGYRLARIMEMLRERNDWDVASTQAMQLDETSIPWRDMRDIVLGAPARSADTRLALDLLTHWDGRVTADAPAAAIFEFFVAEMARRVAQAKAPRSARWVLGLGFAQLLPYTSFSFRRVGHLVELMSSCPKGWFNRTWPEEIASALEAVVGKLRELRGDDPGQWAWGMVRPVTLRHPVGEQKPLDRVFNLGPVTWGGDSNTIAQTSVDPLDATNDPGFIASLRMVADVGSWEDCRWVLPAGQSGNPFSDHYADQLPLWQKGSGVPIAWSPEAVAGATVQTLRLVPEQASATA